MRRETAIPTPFDLTRWKKRYIALALIGLAMVLWLLPQPSNDRIWFANQAVLPSAEFEACIAGVRVSRPNFRSRLVKILERPAGSAVCTFPKVA